MGNSVPSCSACDVTQREVSASTSDGLVALEAESVPVEIKSETAAPEKSAVAEVTTEGSPKEPTEPASDVLVAAQPEEAAKPAMLLITFEAKATGKETELSFKMQPLPFEVKPEAKGGCCAKGNTGRFAIKKVEAKKAQEYYDLKIGMLIKKIDGFELPKGQDWPEFQKLLATKAQALPKEGELKGIVAINPDAAKTEPTEAPKDEAPKTEVGATKEETKPADGVKEETKEEAKAEEAVKQETKEVAKEEASKEAEAVKEETKEVVKEETKEAPKEADASKEMKETEAVKEESKEAIKEADAGKEASAEEPKEVPATEKPKEAAAEVAK